MRSCSNEHEEDEFVCRCVESCLSCPSGLSDKFVCQVCLSGFSDGFVRIVCAATQPWRTARGRMCASARRRWETWLEDLATSTGKLRGRTGQLTPLQNLRWRTIILKFVIVLEILSLDTNTTHLFSVTNATQATRTAVKTRWGTPSSVGTR